MTPHIPTVRSRRRGRARPGVAGAGRVVGVRAVRGRGRGLAALLAALSAAGLAACSSDPAPAEPTGTDSRPSSAPSATGGAAGQVGVLATGLEVPWGIAFLPDGDALVTERDSARILRVPAGGGTPAEVQRLSEVDGDGEGGLLGIAVPPTYARDQLVYVYYSTADDNRIARMRARPAAAADRHRHPALGHPQRRPAGVRPGRLPLRRHRRRLRPRPPRTRTTSAARSCG